MTDFHHASGGGIIPGNSDLFSHAATNDAARQIHAASFQALLKDYFFLTLFAVFIMFAAAAPEQLGAYQALVDQRTITMLAGLPILTKGVEMSGYLH